MSERKRRPVDKLTGGLWFLCLGLGTILLVAGRQLWVPGVGLALTATAFFRRLSDPGKIRSLVKWMIPVLVFLFGYGLLLHFTSTAEAPVAFSATPLGRVAHLFLRSVGMIFAVFALEEALRPLALRARAGGFKGGTMTLMLGLSYQLVPVFLQSLEGVALAQRADARLWWLRPSCLVRAASSVFLLSHRLSEELALALSLRLRQGGAPAETGNREEDILSIRNRTRRILFSLLLATTCLTCGLEQDISFDEPEALPPSGPSVTVVWGENEVEVFLDELDKILVEDAPVCLLRDILLAAGLEEEDILAMLFDFESEDGFRPTSVGCDPLEGATLALGYLDPDTMALVWDSSLGLRGCYRVTQTARILGEPA